MSTDYPYIIHIGPSYFESYYSFPGSKFSHGFNMGKNSTAAMNTLLETVPLACKALKDGRLMHWELGNEPDLFKTTTPHAVRPADWSEEDYVDEWLSKTELMKRQLAKSCPDMATDDLYKFIAPSFAGMENSLNPVKTWQAGLDDDHDIALNSMHK